MRGLDISIDLILLSILFLSMTMGLAFSQDDGEGPNHLILSVYVDDGGRALINGYADDPGSLPFLNSSEYTYEEDGRLLYAITSALTSKSRDNWTVSLASQGSYDEYQIMLYFPANAKLKRIDCSLGLDYLVSTANNSVLVEVHGAGITNPTVIIDYMLPVGEAIITVPGAVNGAQVGYSYTALATFILLAICSGLLISLLISRRASPRPAGSLDSPEKAAASAASRLEPPDTPAPIAQGIEAIPPPLSLNEDAEGKSRASKTSGAPASTERRQASTQLTSEISAVMDTLTDREQSVLRALLRRGGTMTQTEIRYDVDISKSSLSGILTAMEKRKIITKREKGRTNVIELSERFLNLQERS